MTAQSHLLRAFCLLFLWAPTSSAQEAREPVKLFDLPSGQVSIPAVDSDGDLSAVLWTHTSQAAIYISVSDGRGIEWSAPLRADNGPDGKAKSSFRRGLAVVGDQVYVAWSEFTPGVVGDEAILNVYNASTGLWSGESRIPNGFPLGVGTTFQLKLSVDRVASVQDCHVVLTSYLEDAADPMALFYTRTSGFGSSWLPARQVSPPSVQANAYGFDLVAREEQVHVCWVDQRSASARTVNGAELYYQRSTDRGVSFLPADVQLDASGAVIGPIFDELQIAVAESQVAVSWVEEEPSNDRDNLHVAVSANEGATFGPDHLIGQYPPQTTTIYDHEILLEPDSGAIVLTWVDNRTGLTQLYSSRSLDDGTSWSPDLLVSSGSALLLKGRGNKRFTMDGTNELCVSWVELGGLFSPKQAFASYSMDAGQSFEPRILLEAGFLSSPSIAFNERYGNYLCAWRSESSATGQAPVGIVAGGFRPQSIEAAGWSSTSPSATFEFSGFELSAGDLGLILLSGSTGSLLEPGGLDLGVTADALFSAILPLIGSSFSTTLGLDGSGATPSWTLGAPAGLTFQAPTLEPARAPPQLEFYA